LTPPCYQLQKPPETAALFLRHRRSDPNGCEKRYQSHQIAGTLCFSEARIRARARLAMFEKQDAGNHKNGCGWTLVHERAMICSS